VPELSPGALMPPPNVGFTACLIPNQLRITAMEQMVLPLAKAFRQTFYMV